MIVATIEISFSKGSAPDLIAHMVEDGRQYCFISDCDLPAGCGADIEIVKPDGLFVIAHCTVANNQIIASIPEQATTTRGMAHYIIKVKQTDDAVIFSASGTIWIDDGLITDDMLESIAQVYGLKFPDDFLTTADLTDYVTIQDLAAALQPYALSADIPEIEGNPTGAASTTLNKLRINNDIFSMPDPQHIYSTTEHIAGKWIDESPVYEKSFINTIGAYDSNITGYLIASNVLDPGATVINISGALTDSYGTGRSSLNGLGGIAQWALDVHINGDNQLLLWAPNYTYGSGLVGGTAVVTIQYIKTLN